MHRTHTCGELRDSHLSQTVTLCGWVNTVRAYPSQVFVDLRDRYGVAQVVVESGAAEAFALANQIGREWALAVTGKIVRRQPGKENPNMPTGQVELQAIVVKVLNQCPTPPFEITEFPGEELANEDLRLQYRFLDLRRPSLHKTLATRHRMNKTIRDFLDGEGFLELETPLLGRSTPEGARDYLVPSRLFHGEFYALPQSPQIYKQLLMVSGYDKYFQIARCLRDEDLRADRQPEFTQLDLEMSFVEMEDVFGVIERLVAAVFKRCLDVAVPLPIPRLKYAEVMLRYGSDKPDLRYGLEIVDVGEIAGQSEFKVFKDALAAGGVVRGINVKGGTAKYSNTELKAGGKLPEYVGRFGAKGLAFMKAEGGKLVGGVEKFFSDGPKAALRAKMDVADGDLVVFVAEKEEVVCQALGQLRTWLAADMKLVDPQMKEFKFAWVLDFPSFIWDEEEQRFAANHHPFTAPMDEDLHLMETEPAKVRAKAYDLVLNGYEVGGGSIRIHSPEVQARLFKTLGMTPEQSRHRFGFLLDALSYGAPPHGGIALGLDRFAMILAGTSNIRDVIAFPKNQRARDLMTGAPATVDTKQLKELGLPAVAPKG